jgi:putative endonuclease
MMWWVYLVRCRDRTLYCGIAKDIAKRIAQHDAGKGARYTRGRGPVKLVFAEAHATMGDALRREHAIKRLTVSQKRALIRSAAPRGRVRATKRSP